MKNIICFINSIAGGGAERQLVLLANLLHDKGYTVTFVTFSNSNEAYILKEGITRIRIAHNKKPAIRFLYIMWFFLKCKTDCVISFGQRENFLCLIPLMLRRDVKVIAGERNFTYGTSDFIERILIQFLYRRANFIVPNSFSQRDHIVKLHGLYKDKVITIQNYTDVNYFCKQSLPLYCKRRIAVFGRYNYQKNYQRFFEALALFKKYNGSSISVEWFGEMSEDKGNEYKLAKTLVKKNGIEDIITLNDRVSDVPSTMSRFDIVCLPSLFEGFSNSIAEAICCGKPMIVSDVSDNKTMVKNAYNGFLFDPLSIEDIAEKIKKITSLSNEELQQMGDNSRSIAEQIFKKSSFLEAYINLIE